jgi:hypothetical protein
MQMKVILIPVLSSVFLFIFGSFSFASTGSLTSAGGLGLNPSYDTGVRELIKLEKAGPLLKGQPKHSSIKLITLYAPGSEEGHLILRELNEAGGRKSLLFTAPSSIASKVRRITVFINALPVNTTLFESVKSQWRKQLPQLIGVGEKNISDSENTHALLAYSFKTIGLYLLVEGKNQEDLSGVALKRKDVPALGSINRGLTVVGLAALVLIFGWFLSNWMHGKDYNDAH